MKRALLSVSELRGLREFAQNLQELGYEIVATTSTRHYLEKEGLTSLVGVDDVTHFPEMLSGRVKTLHPLIHGGILAVRDDVNHQREMAEHDIQAIDLVCVNLYPFKQTISKPDIDIATAIENIDIGGPALLRSAAKNHRFVTVLVDPDDYPTIVESIRSTGDTTLEQRRTLAAKVFAHTASYDSLIADYLNGLNAQPILNPMTLTFDLKQTLRYGENPHQLAWFYQSPFVSSYSMASAQQLHGKELSYNNIQDGDAALRMLRDFADEIVCVAVKHMNPCGIAVGTDVYNAFERTYDADPVSIFGGIVAFNREVDLKTADRLASMFLEIIIAPSFSTEAFKRLCGKKNIRLLKVDLTAGQTDAYEFKSVTGGLLKQEIDLHMSDYLECVSQREVSEADICDAIFAQKVVKHVKSNAIVVVKNKQTLGIGGGQMNRVGSAKIALEQAGEKAKDAVMGSDAYFPMADTVELAAEFGIRTIIQPGGSIRDEDSIKACDEAGMAMIFTGERHFKH